MTDQPRRAVDTSVAVPLLVTSHEAHDSVTTWAAQLERARTTYTLVGARIEVIDGAGGQRSA